MKHYANERTEKHVTQHDHRSTLDPESVIRAHFQAAFRAVFGNKEADPLLQSSAFADIQSNAALGLAKKLGEDPWLLAQRIVDELDKGGVASVADVTVSGPGYINVVYRGEWIVQCVQQMLADPRLGVPVTAAPQTVVVDYSSPNVAKEMHVGHLRTTVVGDAIVRCLEFLGHRVVRNNHVGDWGTQFGMLVEYLLDQQSDDWNDSAIGDLTALYRAAKEKYDADEDFAARSRERVVKLQAGDSQTLQVWRKLVAKSMEYFNRVYRRLGVTLTDADVRGESAYNDELAQVAYLLLEGGHAEVSDGALCVFPDGFVNREGGPQPFIVRKRDGGFGYATTDLAALRYRVSELEADRIVYVVGAPQWQHFQMLFAVARRVGWLPDGVKVEHVQIGNVLGPDKKMLRTRAGKTVKLMDLLDEAVRRAGAEYDEVAREGIDADTRAEIAEAVGIGAVKFADLRRSPDREYVYDPDQMVRLQGGNTGPYLQYVTARIWSIFRKGGLLPESARGTVTVGNDKERALALHLLGFGSAVQAVADTSRPNVLADYLNGLAGCYSAFYQECKVLDAPDPGTKASRLALCAVTLRTMETGLDFLGIRSVERM